MTSNDASAAVSVPKETTLSSTHVTRESPAAAAKPELHPLLGEDGGEWEGFYEEGDWVEL